MVLARLLLSSRSVEISLPEAETGEDAAEERLKK
jgi:hypothetical protein